MRLAVVNALHHIHHTNNICLTIPQVITSVMLVATRLKANPVPTHLLPPTSRWCSSCCNSVGPEHLCVQN